MPTMKLNILYISLYMILQVVLSSCTAQVTIIRPPENTTVCIGSDVNTNCGHVTATALPVTWIINGTSFNQQEIVNSPLYQLNNPSSPTTLSLTVFSINSTTTFQCLVLSTPNITTSTRGTVTVIAPPMTAPTITGTTPLSNTSFTVSWTISNTNYDNIIVILTNLRIGENTSITVLENTNSYTVTGLNGIDNYNVSVTANNSCGMMMSDPITVYGPPAAIPVNIRVLADNITTKFFIVQWDAVMDHFFTINYIVRWYGEDGSNGTVTVNGLSYTVIGLTANTSYNVSVAAINTCCGTGPVSNVMVITNDESATLPPPTTLTPTPDSSSLSTGAAVAIGCVITLLVSVTVTTIVTAVIMYLLMKRKYESTPQDNINKVLYEEVTSPSHTSKNDVELQQNPAYGAGSKVVMDTNPAYESYK